MSKNVLVVHALIVNDTDELLLLKRAPDDYLGNLWDFPGGIVDEGEELFAGLQREVHEETGLSIQIGIPLSVNTGFYQGSQYITIVFKCNLIGSATMTLNHEHTEARWVHAAAIRDLPTVSYITQTLMNAGLIST